MEIHAFEEHWKPSENKYSLNKCKSFVSKKGYKSVYIISILVYVYEREREREPRH